MPPTCGMREPMAAPDERTTVVALPFNSGVPRGRNAALAAVATPYALVTDDDVVFTAASDLLGAVAYLEDNPDVDAVCATAAHVHVDLVLVDELHNLNLGTRSGAEASDQLKYFAERLPATFAYAGIDIESRGLFAGSWGRQIAGRFVVIPAAPFSHATDQQLLDQTARERVEQKAAR